jgi:ABC-type sugar transport system permease subunit
VRVVSALCTWKRFESMGFATVTDRLRGSKASAIWRTLSSQKGSRYLAVLVLGLPAFAVLLVFRLWPILQSFGLSFFNYNLISGALRWVALDNYATALDDASFRQSLFVSLVYFVLRVPLQIAAGLGLALLVVNPGRRSGLVRTVALFPVVTPMVVVTTLWAIMYHPTNGLFNSVLQTFGVSPQKFLISPDQAMPALVVMTVWKFVGTTMIFYLAGLIEIPRSYYEAAMIDGANDWQLFRHITLPLLNRTTLFVLISTTIYAFQIFTPIFVTTQGGPSDSTRVVVLYIYQQAFTFNRMGYASALSVILAVIVIGISLIQWYFSREKKRLG